MVRSRSSVPPTTGAAMAAITTVSEAARTISKSAAPLQSRTGRLVLIGLRWNSNERLQLEEALLANAFDVHQLLDPFEAAALRPIFDNQLRGLLADAGQRIERLEGGGVE